MSRMSEVAFSIRQTDATDCRIDVSGRGNNMGEWISPSLRQIVLHLSADEADVAARILNVIGEQIPEYENSVVVEHRAEVYAHCLLATRIWYQSLFRGCSPRAEDLKRMSQMGAEKCRLGVSLGALLRAFRVGSMLYWNELIEASQNDPAVTAELLSKVSRFYLHHFDQVSQSVSAGYYEEQSRLLRERDHLTMQQTQTQWPLIEPLTQRELSVLRLLQSGRSNKEMAREMFVCENTIKFHLRNIYGKLGASRRTEAVARAQSLGLDVVGQASC